ncbi:MAG: class II aldolase/adducin family protein, partial [Chloroflexia bacterium]|nr:class II aldolase/adducin family protein [Chloroflexia bacterium]
MTRRERSLTIVPDQSDDRDDAVLREQVAWSCRILAMGGHGDYTLGHVSARAMDGRHILMKPNGLGLEEVAPDDVLALDMDGIRVSGAGPVHL